MEDRFLGGGPDERLGSLVVVVRERLDSFDEFFHGSERPPPDGLLRDDIEPDFDLIEPG